MSIPSGNQNQFFGQKVSKPGINVNQASDDQLIYKNDFSTTTYFTNNADLQLGITPSGGLGMALVDKDGFTLFEMNGQTWFWYDKTTAKNVMQVGKLPDGSYGWAVAPAGQDVADGFS